MVSPAFSVAMTLARVAAVLVLVAFFSPPCEATDMRNVYLQGSDLVFKSPTGGKVLINEVNVLQLIKACILSLSADHDVV